MKGNASYMAVTIEEERQELEAAAHDAWTTWDHRPMPSDYAASDEWRAKQVAAMNRLGVALMRFGLGPGAKPLRDDPRHAPSADNVEAFTRDNRQKGPL